MISILPGDPATTILPAYFCSWMFTGHELSNELITRLFGAIRPFGGQMVFGGPADDSRAKKLQSALPGSRVAPAGAGWTMISREGALPGSANWTHEHADAGKHDRAEPIQFGLRTSRFKSAGKFVQVAIVRWQSKTFGEEDGVNFRTKRTIRREE